MANQAQSNFIVWGYGNDMDLLVNDIAPYSGTLIVPNRLPLTNGALILAIEAEGNWSVEVTTK